MRMMVMRMVVVLLVMVPVVVLLVMVPVVVLLVLVPVAVLLLGGDDATAFGDDGAVDDFWW